MASLDPVRRVTLPGGFVDDAGVVHADVELGPLRGAEEERLNSAPLDAPVAELVTSVLTGCVRRIGTVREPGAEILRQLIVQDRDFLMARVRELSLGPEMWVRLECPGPGCGSEMELKLMLDSLPTSSGALTSTYRTFDEAIEFRLMTGADQEWAAESDAGAAAMGQSLVARCVRDRATGAPVDPERLDQATCDAIEAAMLATAPDVLPEADTICPECGVAFTAEIDLSYLVLAELRRMTRRLDEEVHLLAWHYHWAEVEILAMSRQKRARYIRFIEDQLEQQWSD